VDSLPRKAWVPEGNLAGNLRIGCRPMFGQTLPQNHCKSTGLVLQCRLHQKSAQLTNYKAISRHQKKRPDCLQVPSKSITARQGPLRSVLRPTGSPNSPNPQKITTKPPRGLGGKILGMVLVVFVSRVAGPVGFNTWLGPEHWLSTRTPKGPGH
jgi:hypothetical protein